MRSNLRVAFAFQKILTLLFLALAAFLFAKCQKSQRAEEVRTYQVREEFQRFLPRTRYVNVQSLPSDLREKLSPALSKINTSLALRHAVVGRFQDLASYDVPKGGVLVQVTPHTEGKCSTPGNTIAWVEVVGDGFVVRLCVKKIRTLLNLRGAILQHNAMALKLQAWDHPWVCILAHEIFHTDLSEHIIKGGEGLMYESQPGDSDSYRLRTCDISSHEMDVWGAAVKPHLK